MIIITSQLPTTTPRPHKSYDDEGKWRIIRQEEEKKPQKYDYLYVYSILYILFVIK